PIRIPAELDDAVEIGLSLHKKLSDRAKNLLHEASDQPVSREGPRRKAAVGDDCRDASPPAFVKEIGPDLSFHQYHGSGLNPIQGPTDRKSPIKREVEHRAGPVLDPWMDVPLGREKID